jgi:hypothetical protein
MRFSFTTPSKIFVIEISFGRFLPQKSETFKSNLNAALADLNTNFFAHSIRKSFTQYRLQTDILKGEQQKGQAIVFRDPRAEWREMQG